MEGCLFGGVPAVTVSKGFCKPHIRVMDDAVGLDLHPRFPLFGGWKTLHNRLRSPQLRVSLLQGRQPCPQ